MNASLQLADLNGFDLIHWSLTHWSLIHLQQCATSDSSYLTCFLMIQILLCSGSAMGHVRESEFPWGCLPHDQGCQGGDPRVHDHTPDHHVQEVAAPAQVAREWISSSVKHHPLLMTIV